MKERRKRSVPSITQAAHDLLIMRVCREVPVLHHSYTQIHNLKLINEMVKIIF